LTLLSDRSVVDVSVRVNLKSKRVSRRSLSSLNKQASAKDQFTAREEAGGNDASEGDKVDGGPYLLPAHVKRILSDTALGVSTSITVLLLPRRAPSLPGSVRAGDGCESGGRGRRRSSRVILVVRVDGRRVVPRGREERGEGGHDALRL
jgi:hypothetical protein